MERKKKMAVTLIKNGGVTQQSLQDFRQWAKENPNAALRKNNMQIGADEVQDGDRVNVVVKASGN